MPSNLVQPESPTLPSRTDKTNNPEVPLFNVNDDSENNWIIHPASEKSMRTVNPIRAIVDPIVASSIKSGKDRGDGKDQISLALGDPTAGGNLPQCDIAIKAIMDALQSSLGNGDAAAAAAAGYVNACGTDAARHAIAQYHSHPEGSPVLADNVVIANGCSGALELALTSLLDPGTTLLVPRPGFPLYEVICKSHGAHVQHYNLLPHQQWECDLHHMESLFASCTNIRGIVVNNPSNPTGSVYSEQHLLDIVEIAHRYQVPIVADEVYGNLTFGKHVLHPLARVAAKAGNHVPVITASGLAKQYLLPGWRVGWIVFHDSRHKALCQVEAGAKRLAQVILGASHLTQCAIPPLLAPQNIAKQQELSAWKQSVRQILQEQATFLCQALKKCRGLTVLEPQGAMYAMVYIDLKQFDDTIQSDLDFTRLLLDEENVFVLPGQAFGISNMFRVVYCAQQSILEEAATRISNFCNRHAVGTKD